VLANKDVEKWLTELESVVKKTLRKLLTRAVVAHSKMTRENWILSWPAQLVLTANQIIFTQLMTKLLTSQDSTELKLVRAKLNEQLSDLSQLQTAEKNPLHKKTLTALLLSDIHNRDVVDRFLDLKNVGVGDFEWKSMMRFYWEDQSCVIRILNSTLNYGYEYIGNTSRLVITPATQRIYR
jgi:dynein heavy chain